VLLMDDDCRVLWTSPIPGGGQVSPPNIADFDNDGQPEIGVAGASRYAVFEGDGTLKWSSPTQDFSSMSTGSSTFDFEGDGRAEVVYNDELRLRIYDGATGAVRFSIPNPTGTLSENPVIVDVDADDNAEIVVAANNYHFPGPTGIRVFRDRKDGWVNTRRIWNQHAYSITNVNDDGTIPARPATNWLTPGLNTFRSNSQGSGTTSPYAAADVVASEVAASCDRATLAVRLTARVSNQGDAAASAGLKVAFYRGNPASGGTLLGVATLAQVLPRGGSATVGLLLPSAPGGLAEVWAVADDDGTGTGRELECSEANNPGSAMVDLSCVSNLPPVAVCRDVILHADASCQGSASVDAGSHDPDQQPSPLRLTQSPAGPYTLGSHPVSLTAFDGLESATCTATVTIVDTTPPAVSCPAAPVLECAAGSAQATFSAQALDNCGPVSPTCTPPSGASFPLGTTSVTCGATDASGNTGTCSFDVSVRDSLSPTPGADKGLTLWPPNHQYRALSLSECAGEATDVCAGSLPLEQSGRIVRITSDEGEDLRGGGDGHTCGDMRIEGPTRMRLRAERLGGSDGRVYTVHYVVTDPAGNTMPGTCTVRVPHDPSGRAAVDSGPAFCVGEGCPVGQGSSALCAN
jgi:hypothetical protein